LFAALLLMGIGRESRTLRTPDKPGDVTFL
jgi:hypothetical protein